MKFTRRSDCLIPRATLIAPVRYPAKFLNPSNQGKKKRERETKWNTRMVRKTVGGNYLRLCRRYFSSHRGVSADQSLLLPLFLTLTPLPSSLAQKMEGGGRFLFPRLVQDWNVRVIAVQRGWGSFYGTCTLYAVRAFAHILSRTCASIVDHFSP